MLFKRPLIIAGPCSIETREQTLATCRSIAKSGRVDVLRGGIWKPRTMPGGFEGVGEEGLPWLIEARQQTGLPVMIEVATVAHVEQALKAGIDMLWIGARTTVNPFSVQEIADALQGVDIPILIKNPMNPDLGLWVGAVERIRNSGNERIALIHRGFSGFAVSEYRNAPMWHLALEMRMRMPELPMICDPSHICGARELLSDVAQEAADLNYDGLIIESHINPDVALSDAQQQLTPEALDELLRSIIWREATTDHSDFANEIEQLRQQIDLYDDELFALLSRRMKVAEAMGEAKRRNGVTIFQPSRWDKIKQKFLAEAADLGLTKSFVAEVLDAIHVESIAHQNRVMNK